MPSYKAFNNRLNRLSEAFKAVVAHSFSTFIPHEYDTEISLLDSMPIITCSGKRNAKTHRVLYITTAAAQAVTQSGTYTITETNNTTGCTSAPQQTTVTINPIPVLSLSGPHTACGSYDLTQAINSYDPITYTYTFQGPSPSTNTITTANAQAITQSGTYTITEQNKTTGCTSAPQQTTVTINPMPPQPGITAW